MSGDIGAAFGLGVSLYPSDMRHCDQEMFTNEDLFHPPPLADYYVPVEVPLGDMGGYCGYMSAWWPRNSGLMVGDLGADVSMLQDSQSWGPLGVMPGSGTNGRLSIVGITRDAYGSALPACTVKLFRTSTDELVSQVTSDATTGEYTITTPYYPDGHYLVVYKSGSPDVFGTTVNTLVAG